MSRSEISCLAMPPLRLADLVVNNDDQFNDNSYAYVNHIEALMSPEIDCSNENDCMNDAVIGEERTPAKRRVKKSKGLRRSGSERKSGSKKEKEKEKEKKCKSKSSRPQTAGVSTCKGNGTEFQRLLPPLKPAESPRNQGKSAALFPSLAQKLESGDNSISNSNSNSNNDKSSSYKSPIIRANSVNCTSYDISIKDNNELRDINTRSISNQANINNNNDNNKNTNDNDNSNSNDNNKNDNNNNIIHISTTTNTTSSLSPYPSPTSSPRLLSRGASPRVGSNLACRPSSALFFSRPGTVNGSFSCGGATDGCSQAGRVVRKYRSREMKDRLREAFVDRCKHYMGSPYHPRFHPKEEPANSIYLDCCGLVRQALIDLQSEFNFTVERWNQAYLFDTLPLVLQKKDLRPGDLIFYEGKYKSSVTGRTKPQLHDIVHVEVFLGGETGESTIGARYFNGVVSIFPNIEFKSTTWDLTKLHFRSIDTWLEGTCRSYCSSHHWNTDNSHNNRRFCFSSYQS